VPIRRVPLKNVLGGGGSVQSDDRQDTLNLIASDLVSLISHAQTSTKLVETAIAGELAPGIQEPTNIIVLDDITPRYLTTHALLNTCDKGLGAALQCPGDAELDVSTGTRFRPV